MVKAETQKLTQLKKQKFKDHNYSNRRKTSQKPIKIK